MSVVIVPAAVMARTRTIWVRFFIIPPMFRWLDSTLRLRPGYTRATSVPLQAGTGDGGQGQQAGQGHAGSGVGELAHRDSFSRCLGGRCEEPVASTRPAIQAVRFRSLAMTTPSPNGSSPRYRTSTVAPGVNAIATPPSPVRPYCAQSGDFRDGDLPGGRVMPRVLTSDREG